MIEKLGEYECKCKVFRSWSDTHVLVSIIAKDITFERFKAIGKDALCGPGKDIFKYYNLADRDRTFVVVATWDLWMDILRIILPSLKGCERNGDPEIIETIDDNLCVTYDVIIPRKIRKKILKNCK